MNMTSYPENLVYTKEHEWIQVEGDTGTIGITFHAQKELGDIVFVDLPKGPKAVSQGETFASVESVKAVSDIYAPVSGEIVEINAKLAETPEKLNEDPHAGAWLVKIKLADPEELKGLLNAAQYREFIGE
jgi:glycine cleavage system H protein